MGRKNEWMECHDLLPAQKERVINLRKREKLQSFWKEMESKSCEREKELLEFEVCAAKGKGKGKGKMESPIEEICRGGVREGRGEVELIRKDEKVSEYDKETMDRVDVDVIEYILARHKWRRFPFLDFQRMAPLVGAPDCSVQYARDLPLIQTGKVKLYYLFPKCHMSTNILLALFPCRMAGIHTKKYDAFDTCIKDWTAHLRTKYMY